MLKKLVPLLTILLTGTQAIGQTFESGISSFETPLGMLSTSDIETPVSTVRDERFNRLEVNQPGGGIMATAVGNLINVVSEGSNNTVIVNATQTNSGNQSISINSDHLTKSATTSN